MLEAADNAADYDLRLLGFTCGLLVEGGHQGGDISLVQQMEATIGIDGEIHPHGKRSEGYAHYDHSQFGPGTDKTDQHNTQHDHQKLTETALYRAAGSDRIHADIVIDRVHLMHTIEGFLLLDLGLVLLLAAVEHPIHVEVDAHAIGKGFRGIIRRGQ